MADNLVDQYGWETAQVPHSCQVLAPCVLRILERLSVNRSIGQLRILDLGAGNGALCHVLASRGYDVVGVEYDEGGIATARSAYPGLPFYRFGVQDDPSALLESERPFDAAVSTEVVEHLFSPHLLPRYASGVLNSGGYLIISTPYHGYVKNLALSLLNAWDRHHAPLWHGGHIKFWSRKTLSALLEDNGFDVLAFHGVGRMPFLWKSMILVARKV